MYSQIMLLSLILLPFPAGILVCFAGKRKHLLAACFTCLECIFMAFLFLGQVLPEVELSAALPELCGFGLQFVLDGFRGVFALIATFMWAMVTLLSAQYFQGKEQVGRFYLFLLWTLGATLGVFLSADLMTTFIFFEVMSFTSYVWVTQEETAEAISAAKTYLAIAVIGGLTMLMGIFMLSYRYQTLSIEALLEICPKDSYTWIAGLCILFGFAAKAGAFPVHIWLPKAHPVAPAPASALLSGILTKTGIYGVLILSCRLFHNDRDWGFLILVLGVITMFLGALLAVFSIDLKRTLACSSMSQIGFIMVGIGMQDLLGEENQLALNGTMLHMMNHSLIKLVLFMAAGVIYVNAHSLDLNKLRGFGVRKPFLKLSFLTGALAIGGVPFFGGYISKTLLHESILEYGGGFVFTIVEWIFLLSGGMTLAYMSKLFLTIFIEKNTDTLLQEKYDMQRSYMTLPTKFAMGISTLILFLFGLFPNTLMLPTARLGEKFLAAEYTEYEAVHFFSPENLKGAGISLLLAIFIYLLFIRKALMKQGQHRMLWPSWLDLETLVYRPVLLKILPLLFGILCRLLDCFVDSLVVLFRKTLYKDTPLPHERPEGSALSDFLGGVCNLWQRFANATYRKDSPTQRDYVHEFALKLFAFKESNFIISRSLSFGLLLFCVGLCLTLWYIIL